MSQKILVVINILLILFLKYLDLIEFILLIHLVVGLGDEFVRAWFSAGSM